MAKRIGVDGRLFRKEAGGIGRYTRELLHSIVDLAPDLEFVVFITPADEADWDISQTNVRKVVVDAKHYSYAEQTVFLRALNRERLDLVHFLNFNHPVLYRRPFVATLHDMILFSHASRGKRQSAMKQAVFKAVFTHAMRAAKQVLSVSEYSKSELTKHLGVPESKIKVAYNGRPDGFEIPSDSANLIGSFLGSSGPYFLFISEWRPHKGILTLLDAFEKFKARGHPHRLVLAGKHKVADPAVAERMSQSTFKGDIIKPGFVPDDILPSLFYESTAVIIPSELEGFGIPAVEGHTYGTAVIGANNSSLTETVGADGLLFPTGDASALAELMEKVATDPKYRELSIERGHVHVQKFSWRRQAEITLQVYRDCLK